MQSPRERNTALVSAALGEQRFRDVAGEREAATLMPAALAAALDTLWRLWDAHADEIAKAGKRGAKGQSEQWHWAAGQLATVARSLEVDGVMSSEPIVCDAVNNLGGRCVRTDDGHTSHTYASVDPQARVPAPTTSEAEPLICDTPDFVEGADHKPDRCLLSQAHLGDGSHHQGRYSRWPQRDDDGERRRRNPTPAEIAAYLNGETDDLPVSAPPVLEGVAGLFDDITMTPDQAAKLAALPDATMVIDGVFQSSEEFVNGPRPDDALDPGGAWAWDEMRKPPEERADVNPDIPTILAPDNDAPPVAPQPDLTQVRPFIPIESELQSHKPHRSVSQIELYNECGMKYRLRYRDGVASAPAWYLVGGTAFHAAAKIIADRLPTLAHYEAETAAGWTPSLQALWVSCLAAEIATAEQETGIARSGWRSSKNEDGAWWLTNGENMVRNYFAWHCARLRDGWSILRTRAGATVAELEFNIFVGNQGVAVKGFIDQAWWSTKRGVVEVIDFKTGNSSPGDSFQLGVYAHALRLIEESGEGLDPGTPVLDAEHVTAGYYNPRKDVLTLTATPVLERHPWAEIVYQVTTMDAAERANVYLANTNTNYGGCGSCELRKACPVGARR